MINPKINSAYIQKRINPTRETFVWIFSILILVLMFFPLMATFNDVLTRLVINLKAYAVVRDYIVPFEVKIVAAVLTILGYKAGVTSEYVVLSGSRPFIAEIVWNCIGWQSLLFFVITTFVGLQGDKYTNFSKLKAILIGALGTFLVNIFRIVAVVLVAYHFGQFPASIIHDYGALLVVIMWLFFFWWFCYGYVLEEKVKKVDKTG